MPDAIVLTEITVNRLQTMVGLACDDVGFVPFGVAFPANDGAYESVLLPHRGAWLAAERQSWCHAHSGPAAPRSGALTHCFCSTARNRARISALSRVTSCLAC